MSAALPTVVLGCCAGCASSTRDGAAAAGGGVAVARTGAVLARLGAAAFDGAALAFDGAALALDGAAFARDGVALAFDGAAFAFDGVALARDGVDFARDGAAFARLVVALARVGAGAAFFRAALVRFAVPVVFLVADARPAGPVALRAAPPWRPSERSVRASVFTNSGLRSAEMPETPRRRSWPRMSATRIREISDSETPGVFGLWLPACRLVLVAVAPRPELFR
nr:hypothetical protein [Micromonospora mirobrigensis]